MPTDKPNRVDYHWFLVRTRPGHERKLCALIEHEKGKIGNILEAYCPTNTTVNVRRGKNECKLPLFDGYVFVLATQGALADFLRENCIDAFLRYNRKRTPEEKATLCTIPEAQMRAFREFNENYADKVVVLERPYTDYAFNSKGDEPNEIVRVIDGPLAGCKGYVCRFRRNRGLVFHVQGIMPGSSLTVSYPNVYDLHVVRLHNAEGDRLSIDTEKARAADLVIGMLQACGYGERTLPVFYGLMNRLAANLSLVTLCRELDRQGEKALSRLLAQITGKEAGLLVNLARYEHDNPGYVKQTWDKLVLRPFLTPTSGVEMEEGRTETEFQHKDFTEIIRRVDITEEVYFPSRQEDGKVTTAYYAHIGMMKDKNSFTFFANWDGFLREYFLTAGKANEKLVEGKISSGNKETEKQGDRTCDEKEKMIESFRNFAPTLYKVLTGADSSVKAVKNFKVGETTLNAMVLTTTDLAQGTDELLHTCTAICREINGTNRLAVWRRYLRGVWLHI